MSQILKDYPIQLIPGMETEDSGVAEALITVRHRVPVNYYASKAPSGQTDPLLIPTPGCAAPAGTVLAAGSVRGLWYDPDVEITSGDPPVTVTGCLVSVIDENVYFNGALANPSDPLTGKEKVWIIFNGTQWAVVDESTILIFSGGAFSVDLSASLPGGCCGATYQDGYGIYAEAGTDKFWISGLDDLTTINALDFSTADVFGDTLMGIESDHRELYLFGRNSIEVWYNSGAAAFPFSRSQGGFIEKGCLSGQTVVKSDHRLFWVGDDLAVWSLQGYQPQRISTEAIEYAISRLDYQGELESGDTKGLEAFAYSQSGRSFYVLTIGSHGSFQITYVYDLVTGLWHERQSYLGQYAPGDDPNAWTIRCVAGNAKLTGFDSSHLVIGGLRYHDGVVALMPDDSREGVLSGTYVAPSAWAMSNQLRFGGKRFAIHRVSLNLEGTATTADLVIGSSTRTLSGKAVPNLAWNRCGSYREARLKFVVRGGGGNMIRSATADIEVFDS